MIILGKVCAWIAFLLLVLFCIKPLLRKTDKCKKIKLFLIKHHTLMGILFVLFMILHVIFSRVDVNIMFGKIGLVFIVFSLFSLIFKKKLKSKFLLVHGLLSLIAFLFVVLHIIQVRL